MCQQRGEVERQRQSKQVNYTKDNSHKRAAPNLKPLSYGSHSSSFVERPIIIIPCDVS